jgi:hypothetical protein
MEDAAVDEALRSDAETLRERSFHLPLNIRLMPKSEALY